MASKIETELQIFFYLKKSIYFTSVIFKESKAQKKEYAIIYIQPNNIFIESAILNILLSNFNRQIFYLLFYVHKK